MAFEQFRVGQAYSRAAVGNTLQIERIASTREGPVYIKGTTLLFVTLDKSKKPKQHGYNDYFEGDFFHWDSQTTQNQKSPKLIEIITGAVEVLLFARIQEKVRGRTQPYLFCGRLVANEVEQGSNNPVHMVFEAIDYDPDATGNLRDIYLWSPQSQGLPVNTALSAKGKLSRRAARQGIQIDPKLRKRLEEYSMKDAIRYYEKRGFNVEDTSATRPYDLVCRSPGIELRVEVKGTQTLGEGIIVTRNEIDAARHYAFSTHLYIVHSVQVERSEGGYRLSGGRRKIIRDWKPRDDDLTPIQYNYKVPEAGDTDRQSTTISTTQLTPDAVEV